ncbi:MAG: dockerin type I domain-containing protein [Patescibacteria group bacterium]
MKKLIKTILIISVIVFGAGFLLINSAQAGVIQFGAKNIFVDFDDLPFNLSNWAPGDSAQKTIIINNNENFDINLYFKAKKTLGDDILADVLTITINGQSNHLSYLFDNNMTLGSVSSGKSRNYNIAISFDEDASNKYQGKTINFDFIITAEQIGKNNEEILSVIIPGGGGGGEASAYNLLSAEAQRVDANKDGKIDILDFNMLMIHWGETGTGNIADFNGDGIVDILDFNLLMVNWTI